MDTLTLTNGTGQEHTFVVFPLEPDTVAPSNFPDCPALYVFFRRGTLLGEPIVIYVGETGDLSTRFSGHHKAECIAEHEATHIGVCITGMEKTFSASSPSKALSSSTTRHATTNPGTQRDRPLNLGTGP